MCLVLKINIFIKILILNKNIDVVKYVLIKIIVNILKLYVV